MIETADLSWLRDASALTVAAMSIVAVIVLAWLGHRLATILGNHVLHRLDRQTELLSEIKELLSARAPSRRHGEQERDVA